MAVAYCHYEGWNGMEEDFEKAFEMFVKIEKDTNGYHWSQDMLGVCCRLGQGTDHDPPKSFDWYIKSSEQGNSNAMYTLGEYYATGHGCDPNQTKSVEWYEKAAAQGRVA